MAYTDSDILATLHIGKGQPVKFHKDAKKFTAFDSDLRGKGLGHRCMDLVRVKNPETGKFMDFMCFRSHKDADHDITHWEYTPCQASLAEKFGVETLIIYND